MFFKGKYCLTSHQHPDFSSYLYSLGDRSGMTIDANDGSLTIYILLEISKKGSVANYIVHGLSLKDIHIEVIASDKAQLASLGIGSLTNFDHALPQNYKYVGFNIVITRRDLDHIIEIKPDIVFSGIRWKSKQP